MNATSHTIHTKYDPPPVPFRGSDWTAIFDDYDGAPDSNYPIGFGATEAEAILDLLDKDDEEEIEAIVDEHYARELQSEMAAGIALSLSA